MDDDGRRGAGDRVRQLIVSLERIAVHGLAAGAVRGATDELESEIPELSQDLRLLLNNAIAVLDQLAVVLAEEPPRRLESMAQATAAGAARGLSTTWPVALEASRDLIMHLEEMLDRVTRFAETRAAQVQTPGLRARIAAASGVEGALEALGKGGPQLDAALERGGRSLVRGITGQLRRPFAIAVAAVGALVVLTNAMRIRWRARPGWDDGAHMAAAALAAPVRAHRRWTARAAGGRRRRRVPRTR